MISRATLISLLICRPTLLPAAQRGEPPVIPIGPDACRQWQRWPYQRIGARTYMLSTYGSTGGNESADASHYLYQVSNTFNVSLDVKEPGVLCFARYNHWHGSPWHMAYSRTRYGTGYYIFHQYVPGAKLSQPIQGLGGKTRTAMCSICWARRKLDYSFSNQRAEVFVSQTSRRPGESDWKPAGVWCLAGANTCVYSDPKGELGETLHNVQTLNRRFRDDEFLLPRRLTEGRSSIWVRVKFAPIERPLFQGHLLPELAWSEIPYDAYCFVMPDWKP